jgi:predicted amidohydrolase
LAKYFEEEKPGMDITRSPNVVRFFKRQKELGVDIAIGYGEDAGNGRYNTAVYVSGKTGEVLNKYRKVKIFNDCQDTDSRYIYQGRLNLLILTPIPQIN